ncbi:hypothetical protein CEXT_590161 [Caerostris extrusa]|uniref:Uncharacterized protein n=1 Tax=Caerostris extrusa TaxID=172846 RepID=A0AAV4WQF7_CAEEX|nr:hypothetical protein CEXT_590161 [Caerostris extrusa]
MRIRVVIALFDMYSPTKALNSFTSLFTIGSSAINVEWGPSLTVNTFYSDESTNSEFQSLIFVLSLNNVLDDRNCRSIINPNGISRYQVNINKKSSSKQASAI